MMYHLQIQCLLPDTPQALWEYYERLFVFERLSPPWEPVRMHHQSWLNPLKAWLQQGDTQQPCPLPRHYPLSEGSIRLFDVPLVNLGKLAFPWVTWEALHESVQRGVKFQDFQLRGPFQMWEHRREMQASLPSGELCPLGMTHPEANTGVETHFLRFKLPFGELGSRLGRHFVYQKIYRMFRYRFRLLWDDLARRKTHPHLRPQERTTLWLDTSIPTPLRHPLAWFLNTMGYEVLLGDWLPSDFTGFTAQQKEALHLKAVLTGACPSHAFQYHLEDSTLAHVQLFEYPDSLYAIHEEPLEPLHLLDTLPEALEAALAPHIQTYTAKTSNPSTPALPYALVCYGALVANRGEPTLLAKSKHVLASSPTKEARETLGFRWCTVDDVCDALMPILHRVLASCSSLEAMPEEHQETTTPSDNPEQVPPLSVTFVAHPKAVTLQEVVQHTQVLESVLHNIPFPHQQMKAAAGLRVFDLPDLELPPTTRETTQALQSAPSSTSTTSRFVDYKDAWDFYYGL
jgi:ligand-binding SRPBCC domain-containing protein